MSDQSEPVYGPQEATFSDEHAANLAYFDAAQAGGPDSPAARSAQLAFEITLLAAEQAAFYREPEAEAEAEAGQ